MRLIDADALKEEIDMEWCPDMAVSEIWYVIDKAPTVGGWISVKDRMPEFGKIVLFTGLSSFGTRFITQRGWFDGTFWRRDMGKTVYPSTPVTHWMPLPEGPKEDKDEAD